MMHAKPNIRWCHYNALYVLTWLLMLMLHGCIYYIMHELQVYASHSAWLTLLPLSRLRPMLTVAANILYM